MQNEEAKQSKLRETHAIANLAKRFLGKTFYHLHTLDFRGRIYTSTAYLSHQGTDFSKGLLVRADSKEIGEQGVYWLLVSIATHWGGDAGRADGAKTDKIPLNDRVKWVLANETEILSYAIDFKKNKGWFNADKPWQFLAGCFELKKLREWQVFMKATRGANYNPYAFKSSYTAWLDGSNNGVQHICAITRDEVTAPHANLVPLALPGDLYSYVAEHVWAKIETRVANMSDRERMAAEEIIDELISMKIQVFESLKKGEDKQILAEMLFGFKSKNMAALKKAAPVFWNRITDKKQRRKIAKRNTMTLSYGATPYGMGTQIQDDSRKHGIELLRYSEQVFSTYLGRLIFEDCKESMSKPMRLLEVFEHAGEMAEARKEYLSWHVPITNFPVKQYYTEGKVKKVWVQYGPPKGERLNTERFENTFQLNVAFAEDPGPSPRKQKSGAAPNIVHSLDAAHLQMVVDAAPFGMSVVHDSFGALLADLPELFVLTREKFVELHKSQPLISIMKEIQGDINNVQYGSLDIELVLQSEYAFS
jgi:DNA-directed RNA polymerase